MTVPAVMAWTWRSRLVLFGTALGLAALDLVVMLVAERALAGGRVVDPGPLQLRLVFNPGVAFGLGAGLPGWLVLTVTGLVAGAIAVYAWLSAPVTRLLGRLGLAAILAGATGNLIDRGLDGVVTDYLHTRWWPTFNLADSLITWGAIVVVLAHLLPPRTSGEQRS